MAWGESDDEKYGPDGRFGRELHERHATGHFAEVRNLARIIQAIDPELSLATAERRASEAMRHRQES